MNENVVVLDLETTGLDPSQADIIEFGAWRIENGEIRRKMQFLVWPKSEAAAGMQALTGVSGELEQALPLEAYRGDILELLQDAVLVGHNVGFKLRMLEQGLGIQVRQPVWDTLELARIFFPALGRYNLSSIIERLGLADEIRQELAGIMPTGFHRTLGDAWGSWRILLKCWEKGRNFDLSFFDQASPFLEDWASRSFVELLRKEVGRSFPDRLIRTELAFAVETGELFQSTPDDLPDDSQWVLDCLAPGGLLEQTLPGYETRYGQVKMAETVLSGLVNEHHAVIEAGTGTGKSLAYLIPSIWWARRTGKKVVVATHTIPLQEQLQKKDLPLLTETLPFEFSAVILKGKGNYVCPKKWLGFLGTNYKLTMEEKVAVLGLLVWTRETGTGDVQELVHLPGIGSIWSKVSAEHEDCLVTCVQARNCFLLNNRRRAERADLLIVNHSLLFSDIKTDFKVLPEYDYLIVDEAHHLHQAALEQLGFNLSVERVGRMLDAIHRPQGASFYLGVRSRMGQLAVAAPGVAWDDFARSLAELPAACQAVQDQIRELFRSFDDLLGEQQTLRLTKEHKSRAYWTVLFTQMENLTQRLKDCQLLLERMKGFLAGEDSDEAAGIRRDLTAYQRELEELREGCLSSLEVEDPCRVTWLEQGYALSLKSSPVDVSGILAAKIFARLDCAVLTSATISIGGKFEHFLHEVGLPDDTETCQVESPFDFAAQMQFLVVKDLWRISDREQVVSEQVAAFVAETAVTMNGRTLVLFTSHRLLRMTHQVLLKQLEPFQIGVLAQGVDGARSTVLEEFVHNPRNVLLGANSFWEGIDISGEALSCVILVKLPFWAPSVPLIEARSELIELSGGNSFRDFLLPEAVIRFKQGFGRLIRSQGDRGLVILLDTRIIEKSYGRLFLSSIPVQTHVRGNGREILEHVKAWTQSVQG